MSLTYLSLGCGLQSSALYAGCRLGFPGFPRCDVAIFADTQAEPQWVYDQLDALRAWGGHELPIHVVSKGDIVQDCIDRHGPEKRKARFAAIPAWTRGEDGRPAPLKRQCTQEYKIEAITALVRMLLGYKPRQHVKKKAVAIIGISLDEWARQKPSRIPWVTNTYPLIDMGLSRIGCAAVLKRAGLPIPKKSACYFCPYHDDGYWQDLKTNHPAEWAKAVAFDLAIRNMTATGIASPVYLHRSLTPLDVVALRPKPASEEKSLWDDVFLDECEGMCSV